MSDKVKFRFCAVLRKLNESSAAVSKIVLFIFIIDLFFTPLALANLLGGSRKIREKGEIIPPFYIDQLPDFFTFSSPPRKYIVEYFSLLVP